LTSTPSLAACPGRPADCRVELAQQPPGLRGVDDELVRCNAHRYCLDRQRQLAREVQRIALDRADTCAQLGVELVAVHLTLQ
jgi:hypothetical protein